MTSHPTDTRPEVAAAANMGPDVLASRPRTIRACRFRLPAPCSLLHMPKAAAQRATTSGVRSVPTRPRTPDTLTIRVSDMDAQCNVGIRPDGLPWHGWEASEAVAAASEWAVTLPRQRRAGTP